MNPGLRNIIILQNKQIRMGTLKLSGSNFSVRKEFIVTHKWVKMIYHCYEVHLYEKQAILRTKLYQKHSTLKKKWEKHTTGTCNAQNQYYNYSTKRLNEATQRDNCLLPVPHYHDDLGKQFSDSHSWKYQYMTLGPIIHNIFQTWHWDLT